MRDNRFKAVHCGGTLDVQRHRLLALWAADCAEHVLSLFREADPKDDRARSAIEIARAWARGKVTAGEARAAAVKAHAAARNAKSDAPRAAARAAGHAVATAHMADHARGAATYAIKAVQAANDSDDVMAVQRERAWQEKHLPRKIRSLILSKE